MEPGQPGHFCVAAAEAMRRIVIEHARAGGRLRSGGPGPGRISLTVSAFADPGESEDPYRIVAFDEAFRRLQERAPRVAEVVRPRFYAGLPVEQTATALKVSPRTVNNDWAFTRAGGPCLRLNHGLDRLTAEELADEEVDPCQLRAAQGGGGGGKIVDTLIPIPRRLRPS